jgi:hypothetical protein
MPKQLQTNERAECVYTVGWDELGRMEFMGWPIMNKTERYLWVAAFGRRLRIDREEFEIRGRFRGTEELFYREPKRGCRVWMAPVWLTDREAKEEAQRLEALKLLGEV